MKAGNQKEPFGEAVFYRKAVTVHDFFEPTEHRQSYRFTVERIIEIPEEAFARFSQGLYEYYRFLYDYRDTMYWDTSGCLHCLLVTTKRREAGILVEAEGYAYPRYSAYLENCNSLNLSEVEVIKDSDLSHNIPEQYYGEAAGQRKRSGKERQVER